MRKGLIWPKMRIVLGSFEYGNEPFGSTKVKKLTDWVEKREHYILGNFVIVNRGWTWTDEAFYKIGPEKNCNMVALIVWNGSQCHLWRSLVPFMHASDICHSQCFLKPHWLVVAGGRASASTNDMTMWAMIGQVRRASDSWINTALM